MPCFSITPYSNKSKITAAEWNCKLCVTASNKDPVSLRQMGCNVLTKKVVFFLEVIKTKGKGEGNKRVPFHLTRTKEGSGTPFKGA